MKKLSFLIFFTLVTFCASAQFQVSGKLRVLRPLDFQVQDLNGKIVLACKIENGKEFKSKKIDIVPDLYKVTIGANEETMFLQNEPLLMKGYLNDKDLTSSNFTVTGASQNDVFKKASAKLFGSATRPEVFSQRLNELKGTDPLILAAAIVTQNPNTYEPLEMIYNQLPKEDQSVVKTQLKKLMLEKELFKVGGQAVDFTLVDRNNKEVSLSEFKGKFVLLDFWASWCNPCRMEMKSLHKIYGEIKADDLIFISISLDDDREKWLKAMDADAIPWVALWDKDGFKESRFRDQFGFRSIPFIVLIGKDGKTIVRDIRGEQVKNAIQQARNSSK